MPKPRAKIILLVEDNPDDVTMTLDAFKEDGILCEVVVARDGVEAMDYLFGTGSYAGRETKHKPSIILLDLKLPRVGGLEVLQRIRAYASLNKVPIVVWTASKDGSVQQRAESLGVDDYIQKSGHFDRPACLRRQAGVS